MNANETGEESTSWGRVTPGAAPDSGELWARLFKLPEAAMAAKRKWRWVSRDTRSKFVSVWIGSSSKPESFVRGRHVEWFNARDSYVGLCYAEFRAVTGLTIKPGTCVRVEFGKAKVLK